MDRTQLQMRIEASVTNNADYPVNTYFIDLKGYGKNLFSNVPLLEDDAVQARLAHMDFGKVSCDIMNKYRNSNFLLKKYAHIKIRGILIRNSYLRAKVMTKAIIKIIRRKTLSNLLGENFNPLLIHELYNFIDNTKDLVDNNKAHKI